ncbi:MAG: TetR/AcrR family transcriptional regulator [Actinomycetes bacterium]
MIRRAPQVRRDELLRATCDVIARQGLARTRVADVAARVGVSPALVLYHFATKESLLAQAFAWAAEEDLTLLREVDARPGSATQRLRAMLDVYAPAATSPGWRLWIEAWAAALHDPEIRKASRRLDARWAKAFTRVIAEGVASGEFRCAHPEESAWRIAVLLDGLAVQVVVHKGLVTARQMYRWSREAASVEVGIEPEALLG